MKIEFIDYENHQTITRAIDFFLVNDLRGIAINFINGKKTIPVSVGMTVKHPKDKENLKLARQTARDRKKEDVGVIDLVFVEEKGVTVDVSVGGRTYRLTQRDGGRVIVHSMNDSTFY